MSIPRANHVSESVNGKLYVLGGVTASGPVLTASVEEYDPNADSWSFRTSMSSGRQGMGSAVFNNKIYLFGGFDNSSTDLSTVEEYDPANNTWSTKSNLPTAFGYVSAATVGALIYVFPRSQSGSGLSARVYAYDPSNDSWSGPLANLTSYLNVGRDLAVVGSSIYFLGRDPILIYDTQNDAWSKVDGDYGITGNGGKGTAVFNNSIYVFDELNNWQTGLSVYTIGSTIPRQSAYSPFVRTTSATSTLGNGAYITGGCEYDSSISSDLYRFNP